MDTDYKLEQLKLLYDYGKFHIGLYGTLLVALIAILKVKGEQLRGWSVWCLRVTVVLLLLAAMTGSVIPSSILDTYGEYSIWEGKPAHVDNYWKTSVGPFGAHWFAPKWWTLVEHITFWAAVLLVVLTFLFDRHITSLFDRRPNPPVDNPGTSAKTGRVEDSPADRRPAPT